MERRPTAVTAAGLGCRYGRRWALRDVTLEVEPGEVFGILGPNGAGKTTLIDAVCGLIRPTEGRVEIFGADVARAGVEARARIGVLPQETALYDELDPVANLRFAARLYGVENADARIDGLLALVGLQHRRRDRVGTFSGGMKRRLAIARTLLHDPPLLVFDEPTVGVDVDARHAIWQHVRGLRADGRTVVLTTNYLDEAEALCDRVAVLRDGRLVAVGSPAELIARVGRCVDVDCPPATVTRLATALLELPAVTRVDPRPGGATVFVHGPGIDDVVAAAMTVDGTDRHRTRSPALAEVFELLAVPGRAYPADPAAVDPAAVDPAAVDPAAVDPAAVDRAAVTGQQAP